MGTYFYMGCTIAAVAGYDLNRATITALIMEASLWVRESSRKMLNEKLPRTNKQGGKLEKNLDE